MSSTSNTNISIGTSVEQIEYRRADEGPVAPQHPVSTTATREAEGAEIVRFESASSSTVTVRYDPIKAEKRATFRRITRRFAR
jgi:hypothetical protein